MRPGNHRHRAGPRPVRPGGSRRNGPRRNPPPEIHEEYGNAALERAEQYAQELRRLCAEVESFEDPRTGSVFIDNTSAAVECADVAMIVHAEAIRAYWNLVDSGNEVGAARAEDLAAFAHEKLLEVLAQDLERGPGMAQRVANTHDPRASMARISMIIGELENRLAALGTSRSRSVEHAVRDTAECSRLLGLAQGELGYVEGVEARALAQRVASLEAQLRSETAATARACARRAPNPRDVDEAMAARRNERRMLDELTRSGR